MGFDKEQARIALAATGGDVIAATMVLSETRPEPAPARAGDPVDQLVSMGFDREQAERALAASEGNVRSAIIRLSERQPEPAPAPAPVGRRDRFCEEDRMGEGVAKSLETHGEEQRRRQAGLSSEIGSEELARQLQEQYNREAAARAMGVGVEPAPAPVRAAAAASELAGTAPRRDYPPRFVEIYGDRAGGAAGAPAAGI